MFYKHSREGKIVVLIVYVDDIILTGNDSLELERLKKALTREFDIKDLGPLRYFFGMEFARSKKGSFISQRKNKLDLLSETGLLGCKATETPIEPNLKLQPTSPVEVIDKEKYQCIVRRLIYLSHTRPNIAFVVSMVIQFMHSPNQGHLDVVYRILRDLKGTLRKGLLYENRGHLQLNVFIDADWVGNVIDRRSTSRYYTFVGGNLVTWQSKK